MSNYVRNYNCLASAYVVQSTSWGSVVWTSSSLFSFQSLTMKHYITLQYITRNYIILQDIANLVAWLQLIVIRPKCFWETAFKQPSCRPGKQGNVEFRFEDESNWFGWNFTSKVLYLTNTCVPKYITLFPVFWRCSKNSGKPKVWRWKWSWSTLTILLSETNLF